MPTKKEDLIGAIRNARREVERLASSAPESAWLRQGYEQGWNAKQLLCHVAASSNVAGFLLAMARNPGASFGHGVDEDQFNAQQVALRESKTIAETVDEALGHLERDIDNVNAAPEELLAAHYRAPWGYEGPLADVMLDSLQDHLTMHVRDLARAVS